MTESATRADLRTPNARKYVQQLCRHWQHKLTVEIDGDKALITMPSGDLVALDADDARLAITITGNPDTLTQTRGVVVDHIDRFAFREAPLDYAWQ